MKQHTSYKYSVIFFTALILSVLCLSCCDKPAVCERYLVLYAFDEEGAVLRDNMTDVKKETHLGREIYIGELSGQQIVLAGSGIGMNNAAMTTQHMIDSFKPAGVIFSGIAGGIDSSVHIGDIVAASSWVEHDYGHVGAEGFEHKGAKAYSPTTNEIERMVYFYSDSLFLDILSSVPGDDFEFEKIGERIPRLIIGGIGASGNTFIDNIDKRAWLSEKFEALVVDMESASVAQVCTVNGVPFIIFRSASDLAGGSGSATADDEMDRFFRVAAGNSAHVVIRFLKELK